MRNYSNSEVITSDSIKVKEMKRIIDPILTDGVMWREWRQESYRRTKFAMRTQALRELDNMIMDLAQNGAFTSQGNLKHFLMGDYGLADFDKGLDRIYHRITTYRDWRDEQQTKKPKKLKKK